MKGKAATKLTAAVLSAVMLLSPLAASAEATAPPEHLTSTYEAFQTPPLSAKTRPLWFWNSNVADMTEEQIREIMINSKEQSGYAGFGILPFQDRENFMGERYLELYRCALETAEEVGMTMCLYDEYGFPSGYAGGQVGEKYPEHLAKRLDKYEKDVEGPAQVELPIGTGTLMGAVLMNNDTKEILDISDNVVKTEDQQKIRSSSTYSLAEGYDSTKVIDNDPSTRWNAASNHPNNQWIELDYGEKITFDRVVVIEPTDPAVLIRVNEYAIQYYDEAKGDWTDCASGVKIGGTKEHTFAPVTARRVRLFIKNLHGSADSPTISEFQVYNGDQQQILNVDREYTDQVIADVPEGNWKAMAFSCVLDGYDRVDYLEPDSVDKFIELTYDTYYEAFGKYFGTVIDSAFYDEPTFMSVQGGRTWTPRFNEMFEDQYGYNPITLYPALWYDIGEDTAAARVKLHDFRAELFAKNYIGRVNEWCNNHGITLQGHMIYEEVPNPVTVEGDFMKAFKYQDIPGVDMIGYYRYTEEAYKLVSSSAYNWDKQHVMSETYGAIWNMPKETLYKTAMDQYAKGINIIIPHAVWYNDDPSTITFQPELSYRREFADELPVFNNYIGRLNSLMQDGRHAADIGVLYPIESLQGFHSFQNTGTGPASPAPDGTDYMQVGELLLKELQKDYTWVHPEVLGDRCTVEGDSIKLNNEVNFEEYKVFVMPGAHTISYENFLKIKQFYDNGGKVIATSKLPYQSSEPGHDADVAAIIKEMFGVDPTPPENETEVVVTASSEFESPGYEASKACDGSQSTRWNTHSFTGGNQWLEVDFGKEITFNKTITREAYDRTRS
ncbi:MAG: hypothetical protein HFE85_02290, partial [Clostridiales bacterium]|nr:hypothetical protein [Clostridiales bacterium]